MSVAVVKPTGNGRSAATARLAEREVPEHPPRPRDADAGAPDPTDDGAGYPGRDIARALFRARRRRAAFITGFAASGEAWWDMLLLLYAQEAEQRQTSVSQLCLATGGPRTTALRNLVRLEQAGLVRREDDTRDGRRWWVNFTPRGRSTMQRYLEDVTGY